MNLAQRVRTRRAQLGLSQMALAKRIGIPPQTLQHVESGLTEQPRFIKKLAEVLESKPEWLLFGVGEDPDCMAGVYSQLPKHRVPILAWDEVPHWCIPDESPLPIQGNHYEFTANPNPANQSGKQFALRIKNDVMLAPAGSTVTFPVGMVIVADPELPPKPDCYLIGHWSGSQEVIFRQYIVDGHRSYLKALNPQYPLQEIIEGFAPLAVVIYAGIKLHPF